MKVLQQYTLILRGPQSFLVLENSLMPHFHSNRICWLSFVKWWYFKVITLWFNSILKLLVQNWRRRPKDRALCSCLLVVINMWCPLKEKSACPSSDEVTTSVWAKHPDENSCYFRREIACALVMLQQKYFCILSKSANEKQLIIFL